ncbi:MAG: hypothetical protein H8E31_00590 [Planctomycetes bacterium]|nr:hypothetical protein [Planctomycetota bacterium]
MTPPLSLALLCVAILAPATYSQQGASAQAAPRAGLGAQPLTTGRAVGALDQFSPFESEAAAAGVAGATFNADSFHVWQSDVRAGADGVLEGFELECNGPAGAVLDLRIRMGGGWNTNPVVWSGSYTKLTGGTEIGWADTSAAGILLHVGEVFLIEWQGASTGVWITGTYVPAPGTPAYPEPIYLYPSGCYLDCGWRIGFHTYMSASGPQLSATPLVAGAPATLSVSGATPNRPVGFAYSLKGPGPSTVSAGPCGSVTLDLSKPVATLAILSANGVGYVAFTGNVPPALSGRTIWLQAFDVASCTASNPLAEVVG